MTVPIIAIVCAPSFASSFASSWHGSCGVAMIEPRNERNGRLHQSGSPRPADLFPLLVARTRVLMFRNSVAISRRLAIASTV
jgi:hypothetical protein